MLGLCGILLAKILKSEDSANEEQNSDSPHNYSAKYAAKRCANTAYDVRKEGNTHNERCVGKLSLNVVNVVTVTAGRSKYGGIRDRRDVVAVNRAAKSCGNGKDGKSICLTAENCYRDRNENSEGTQEVPVEKAIAQARMKKIAGKSMVIASGIFSMFA